jgi:lipopolysaccharide export system permease protein
MSESRAYLVVKSAGVSLPRLAWPVFVVGALLAVGMGYFNNEMLPEANHRMNGLWRDIRVSRPTFALTPGEFYTGIAGYAIRAEALPPDQPGLLDGVTVFETRGADGAQAVVTAARARLEMQGGTRLTMRLEDGEVHRRGGAVSGGSGGGASGEAYERLTFSRYRIAFDLEGLTGFARRQQDDGDASRTDRSMRTSAMLAVVDSLDALSRARADSTAATLARLGRTPGTDTPRAPLAFDATVRGSTADDPSLGASRVALQGLGDADRALVYSLAQERARAARTAADAAASADRWDGQRTDRFRVEIYKKNSIALACLVFVLVGVPLGLSVARAGVGLVATLAVFVFLFYWISLVQGEKLADRGLLSPVVGMWAANVIIGVLGVYLFLREARDPAWPDPVRALAGRFARRG